MEPSEHDRRDALSRDPYPLYARAQRAAGLTYVPELDAWLVARDADVREVLRRPEEFSSSGALRPDVIPCRAALEVLATGFGRRPTVVTSDGDAHRRHRAPLNSGLSVSRVNTLMPYVTEQAEALVDAFAPDGGTELMASYARRLPGAVLGCLLGLSPEDAAGAVDAVHRAEELLFRPMEQAEQIRSAHRIVALQRMLDGYACDRRASPRDDLCSALVGALAPGDGELTFEQRNEIVATLQNFLLAGQLTTGAMIGTTLLHLLRHRTQWEMVCERPELVPAAVDEALRHDTALQGFRRTTTRPVTLSGTELPTGSTLFVAYGAANRDPDRHERAGTFDITRRPSRHLAFGHGVHGCPGSQLAREQLSLTVALFARRLPAVRLAPQRPVAMAPTMIHRAPEALWLVW